MKFGFCSVFWAYFVLLLDLWDFIALAATSSFYVVLIYIVILTRMENGES